MKKVLATILCLALMLSCLPMEALADFRPGVSGGGPGSHSTANTSTSTVANLGSGVAVSTTTFTPLEAVWKEPGQWSFGESRKNVVKQATAFVPKKTQIQSGFNVIPSFFGNNCESLAGVFVSDGSGSTYVTNTSDIKFCVPMTTSVSLAEAQGVMKEYCGKLLSYLKFDERYQYYPTFSAYAASQAFTVTTEADIQKARRVMQYWLSTSNSKGWLCEDANPNVTAFNTRYTELMQGAYKAVEEWNIAAANDSTKPSVTQSEMWMLGTLDYVIALACKGGMGGWAMAADTLKMLEDYTYFYHRGTEFGEKHNMTIVVPTLDLITFGKNSGSWWGMPMSVYYHTRGLTKAGNYIITADGDPLVNSQVEPISWFRVNGTFGTKLGDSSGWTSRTLGSYGKSSVTGSWWGPIMSGSSHLCASGAWLISVADWCIEDFTKISPSPYHGYQGVGFYGLERIPDALQPEEDEYSTGSNSKGTEASSGVFSVALTTPKAVIPEEQATIPVKMSVSLSNGDALFRSKPVASSPLEQRATITETLEQLLFTQNGAVGGKAPVWEKTTFTMYLKMAGDGKFPRATDQTSAQAMLDNVIQWSNNATSDGNLVENHLEDPAFLGIKGTNQIFLDETGTDFKDWGTQSANLDAFCAGFANKLRSAFGSAVVVTSSTGLVTMEIQPNKDAYQKVYDVLTATPDITYEMTLEGQPATISGEGDYTSYVFYCGCSINWFQYTRKDEWKDNVTTGDRVSENTTFTSYRTVVPMCARPKIAGFTVSKEKEKEKIFYYSDTKPMYSEFKTGDVYNEPFDAMLGTPTYTDTGADARSSYNEYRPGENDFAGTKYSSQGHYTQYYAVGGSEFVVQFDGSYHANETATRTYSATFSNTLCDNDKGPCQAPHTHGSDPPSPCSACHQTHGCKHNTHQVGDTFTWTQTTKGLCYIAIDNVRVWQLKQTRLEGGDLRELFSEDPIMGGDASAKKIGVSWNIADKAPNAASGRVIYTYETAQGDKVNIPGYPKTSDRSCDSHTDKNATTLHGTTSSITCDAWCVSDYIIIHTSNGDIPILYHEYKAQGAKKIDKTGSGTSFSAEEIIFDPKTQEELWNNNANATYQWDPLDLTYGGYNGKYNQTSTKYNSSGRTSSFDWSQTAIFKVSGAKKFFSRGGGSGGSNTRMNCMHTSSKGSKFNLKMGKWGLQIPDTTRNNDYDTGSCSAFYELVTDCKGPWLSGPRPDSKGYSTANQAVFGGKPGFVVKRIPYTESTGEFTDKINNIVVYNPVACIAYVEGLDSSRDQRYSNDAKLPKELGYACPGDETCDFQTLDCTVTNHLHNESCYSTYSYKVHTGNNVHEHTDECSFVYVSRNCSGKACMASGRHNPSLCPYGHSCSGCSRCHTCEDQGLFSGSGAGVCDCYHCGNPACSNYCSNHRYACSETCSVAHPTKEYTCGDKPLNKHVCVAPGGYSCGEPANTHTHTAACGVGSQTSSGTITYAASGTTVMTFTATAPGTVRFWSTWYNVDPRGVIKVNGVTVVDNDDGGSNLNFDASATVSAGDSITLFIYEYGSTGSGGCNWNVTYPGYNCNNKPLNAHVHNSSCKKDAIGCYDCSFQTLTCQDPHHTWDTCWKVYTYGMLHESGKTCSGSTCTDATPIVNYKGVKVPLEKFKNGYLVQHTDGRVHIAEKGSLECLICGERHEGNLQVKQSETGGNVTLNCTEVHRTLNQYELENYTSHYPYGNLKCWSPCMNKANHNQGVTISDGSTTSAGKFINLDYQFTVVFPNEGNFRGSGKLGAADMSMERGKGYTSPMDTTIWTARKWVEFPFDVSMRDSYGVEKSYLAYERIYLNVPDTRFTFYCVLENSERASCEVLFGAEAINDPVPEGLEANRNETVNTRDQGNFERKHDADCRDYVDVVGRIGAMTIEDVGDFRYSNFFKQTLESWLVQNVIRKVDPSKQRNLVIDPYDIRGTYIQSGTTKFFSSDPEAKGDTYGVRNERRSCGLWQFPLTCGLLASAQTMDGTKASPHASNQQALSKQPVRIGYGAYMDLTTLGNYYGWTTPDDQGAVQGSNRVVVRPRYFRLNIVTNTIDPCDVYMQRNGSYVPINYNTADIKRDSGLTSSDTLMSLNWVEEHVRRNCVAASDGLDVPTDEDKATSNVASQFGLNRPKGSSWVYGTYDYMELWDRNRTSIGTKYTYVPTTENIRKSTDPQSRFPGIRYNLQGARWHFTVGLPSSAVFVPAGTASNKVTSELIKSYSTGDYVIVCGLEVIAYGDVWTLVYDGKNVNGSFQLPDSTGTNRNLTPNGWPQFTYQEKPDKKLILVEIVSINHSSKEDLNQSGTH